MSKYDQVIPVLRDRSANNAIVAILVGYSDEDVKNLLASNPTWYKSTTFCNY